MMLSSTTGKSALASWMLFAALLLYVTSMFMPVLPGFMSNERIRGWEAAWICIASIIQYCERTLSGTIRPDDGSDFLLLFCGAQSNVFAILILFGISFRRLSVAILTFGCALGGFICSLAILPLCHRETEMSADVIQVQFDFLYGYYVWVFSFVAATIGTFLQLRTRYLNRSALN